MKLSIVIPVFNKVSLTVACLDTLQAKLDRDTSEVLVVDDASTDETPRLLPERHPWVRYIRRDVNCGYGETVNAGAVQARGEYLLILNNDTLIESDFIAPLFHRLASSPRIGLVGSRLLYPDRTIQHAGIVFGQDRQPYHIYRSFPANFRPALKPRRMAAVTGACFLMPTALFSRLDGFSSAYRNGAEDMDLCLRLAQAGYETWYEPESWIYHLESQSPGRFAYQDENTRRFSGLWNASIVADDYRCYQEDGFHPSLWAPLAHLTRGSRPVMNGFPMTWTLSSHTGEEVQQVVRTFADTLSRYGLEVTVASTEEVFEGAVATFGSPDPALKTQAYLTLDTADRSRRGDLRWVLRRTTADALTLMGESDRTLDEQILCLSCTHETRARQNLLRQGWRLLSSDASQGDRFLLAFRREFPHRAEAELLESGWHARHGRVGMALRCSVRYLVSRFGLWPVVDQLRRRQLRLALRALRSRTRQNQY